MINERTGRLASYAGLVDVIPDMVTNYRRFFPRSWALENTGSTVSTRRLNAFLKERAVVAGEPWTRDIVEKTNSPNLTYRRPWSEGTNELSVIWAQFRR